MRSYNAIRLSLGASAFAIATAFAAPAQAAQAQAPDCSTIADPAGQQACIEAQSRAATSGTQPSTTNTPTPGQQTTPIETVNRTGLPSANQNQTPPGTEQSIVITGSRIKRPEIESPVPVAVIGQQALLQDAASNISDTLNELPQVAIGSTRTNTNFLTSGTGISTVNLRSLGSGRTLTLVNGRRFIGGFAGSTAVDINNIPTDFIDRVEVVTGGSSAVYGSDAVAGVVNFILKDRFDGVQLRAQTGQTFRGDDPTYFASLTAGQTFFNDRLHLIGNFSWDKDEGLRSRDRSISSQDCNFTFLTNPNTGLPEICGPTAYSSFASQGRFNLVGPTRDPANNNQVPQVLPGNLFTFDQTNALVPGFPVGFGFNRNALRLISVPLERELATGIANFDITPDHRFFAEVTYSHVKSDASIEPLAIGSLGGGGSTPGVVDIQLDNPFIPTDVLNAINAANSDANTHNNVTSIGFRRRSNDIFDRSNHADRHTFRIATGFKGTVLGKYNYELSYVYGRMHDFNESEDINIDRYNNAIDAIRVGPGNVLGVDIVCRDPAARAEGCVPLNIFGHDTADPAAAAYVAAVPNRSEDIINKQHVATASVSGPLFTWWAGDVNFALGGEYRKESTTDTPDLLTQQGLNSGNILTPLKGQYHVWEAFGELNVPLLKDVMFAKYLGVTGAARYSKYSTVGSVFSYNLGAEWQPIRDLRFRAEYAKAVRAPNISELFSQPSQTFAGVTDPCNGVTATSTGVAADECRAIPAIAAAIQADGVFQYTLADLQRIDGFIGGNENLKEETAKTKTLGAVFTPSFVPGLGVTVDYYDIKISDAVGTLGRSFQIQQCLLTGLPVFCANVFRDPNTGFVTRVNAQLINVAELKNRGVDTSISYNRALHILPDDRLSLDLKWTHLINNSSKADPTSPTFDSAGTFGRAFSRDSVFLRSSYKFGIVTLGWQTNYLSGGAFFRQFFTGEAAVDKLNIIPDYWTHDAQLRFDPTKKITVYFNVDNVFDRKPDLLPGAAFGTPTGLETTADEDVFGRRFLAGVRVKFF